MQFRILGPLEVRDNGRAIELGAGKPRALLAVLLLNSNRVVSKDVLIESLWGESPPGTATKALQVYVSQLRKALGKDRILTRPLGYELRIAPGELDVDRVEQLNADGDFEGALDLWRGRPLADFAYEGFAQPEIARLDELRAACLELRIDVDLASGRHAALVGELDGLVRLHPLRERLRAQLMLALYRSGRQADALDVYQAGRKLLADELGLEPGAELKELQRRILAQDPELDMPRQGIGDADDVVDEPGIPPTPREARKTVTVLSCEIVPVGTELDPESLRSLTERGLAEVIPVLERNGATVERGLGGSVTAIFGVPLVNEDDALRAASAALEIRERLRALHDALVTSWGASLDLRVGIGTGEVLSETAGERSLVTGRPVQEALRLRHAAAAGELLLDERTHRLVVRGVDVDTSDAYPRLGDAAPRAPDRGPRFAAPMVGRERETRRLLDSFEQARDHHSCQLFTVLGAPGVGKSRLVHEFVAALSGALVAQGRCLPYGEGITYWPVLEAVRGVVELDDTAPLDENASKLSELLAGVDDAERVVERLAEVAGLSDRASSAEEIASAVRAFVEALARKGPLVLVFDDIHWGEETFLDLVNEIADRAGDVPVLIVCLARPELLDARPEWGGGKLNATTVLLEPLSDEESRTLVDNLMGAGALDDSARHRIVDGAGGNPLFVEEILALVLEGDGDRSVLEIPPTIHALLAARLDRLPGRERAAVEAAAVEGKVFHSASVARLTSSAPEATQEALHALARRGLVRTETPVFSGERAFGFRHLLIRDAAYESTPKAARATLHARHAEWLEESAGDRALELDEIVGYHYEQAYRYRAELGPLDDATRALGRAAATRLGSAGRRALVRSDGPAGVNLISRSVALLPADDPLRVELVPNVRVIQGLSDLTWADRVLTEAIEAAATSGDRALAAHALVQRGFLRLFTDEGVTPRELFEVSDRAIAVFESLGDELGLARAWRLASQAHYLDARPGLCAEASERAWVHARRASDRFEEREIVEWLVIVLLLGPAPAADASARLTALLDETDDAVGARAQIRASLAAVAAMQGDFALARDSIEASRRLMDDLSQWIWIVTFWWAFVHLWAGEFDAAEAETRPAYEALKRLGETSHFSSIAHSLAAIAYAQGRYDEAEELTRECEEACRANDIHSQIMWRAIRAKVVARRGAYEEAELLATEALALAEAGDFLLAHADAAADLGEVLELAGSRDEAARAFERAVELYERKGVLSAAARTQRRLELLAS